MAKYTEMVVDLAFMPVEERGRVQFVVTELEFAGEFDVHGFYAKANAFHPRALLELIGLWVTIE